MVTVTGCSVVVDDDGSSVVAEGNPFMEELRTLANGASLFFGPYYDRSECVG